MIISKDSSFTLIFRRKIVMKILKNSNNNQQKKIADSPLRINHLQSSNPSNSGFEKESTTIFPLTNLHHRQVFSPQPS